MPARRSVPLAAAVARSRSSRPAARRRPRRPRRPADPAIAAAARPCRTSRRQQAIAAAVEAARNRAIPLAIASAREEAQRLAAAGGLTLGPLVSVSEPEPSPFFGGPVGAAYGAEGTFGPGRFCGQIRTPIRRRTRAACCGTRVACARASAVACRARLRRR